jgi:hypothetical protein
MTALKLSAIRWLAWAGVWLMFTAIFDWSLHGFLLMVAGVFVRSVARFVDYMILELGR